MAKSQVLQIASNLARPGYAGFIILTLVFYIFMGFMPIMTLGFNIGINLFFLLWFILGVADKKDPDYVNIRTGAFIIFATTLIIHVVINSTDLFSDNSFVYLYILNPHIAMWWTYFATIKAPDEGFVCWLAKRALILYILGLMLSFIFNAGYFDEYQYRITPEMRAAGIDVWKKSYENLKRTFTVTYTGIKTGVKTWWDLRLKDATGGYYQSKVDEKKNEPLGVYLTDLKASDPRFYYGQPVTVWGTLKARTLDDTIFIDTACYTGQKLDTGKYSGAKGTMRPPYIIIAGAEEEGLDCTFPADTALATGTHQVNFVADFNFETLAYQKRYFMLKESLRSMNSQGIDPLENFKITDKKPMAVSTNGPVTIGMSKPDDNPLMGIEQGSTVLVAATMEKNPLWKGSIKQIKSVVLMVPNSFTLDNPDLDCNFKFVEYNYEDCMRDYAFYNSTQYRECVKKKGADAQQCLSKKCAEEFVGYYAYAIDTTYNPLSLYNIKDFKTFWCRFKVNDPIGVMEGKVFNTKYFRAFARYDFSAEETTSVTIKEDPNAALTTTSQQEYEARMPKENQARIQYVYTTYNSQLEQASALSPCGMVALIMLESSGNPSQVNKQATGDSAGLLQFTRTTASDVRIGLCTNMCSSMDNRLNAEESIKAGYKYIEILNQRMSGYTIASEDREKMLITGFHLGESCLPLILSKVPQTSVITWNDFRAQLTLENLRQCFKSASYTDPWILGLIKTTDQRITNYGLFTRSCQSGKDNIDAITSLTLNDISPQVIRVSQSVKEGQEINIDSAKITIKAGTVADIPYDSEYFALSRASFTVQDSLGKASTSVTINEGDEARPFPLLKIKLNSVSGDTASVEVVTYGKMAVSKKSLSRDSKDLLVQDTTDPLYVVYSGDSIIIKDKQDKQLCSMPWTASATISECKTNAPGKLTAVNLALAYNWQAAGVAQAQIIYNPTDRVSVAGVPEPVELTQEELDYYRGLL